MIQILLLCLQKQLEAGHSKGMTPPVLRVLSDLISVKRPERSRGPGFAVCLQNSKEKGSFASGANFNIERIY